MTKSDDQLVPQMDSSVRDRVRAGMESDGSDPMAPDEMYLMLQADMISIKQQEQILQSEIDEIAAKFHQLLETCGLESGTRTPPTGTMAPPSTPSFLKSSSSASLTQVTNMTNFGTPTFLKVTTTPTSNITSMSDCSDEETTEHLLSTPVFSLLESEVNSCDGLGHDLSSKTLIMDSNSNYLDSPHSEVTDTTPIIEALPILEASDTTTSSSSPSGSSGQELSSDGYPKSSDDSSDNQIVPECYDLDKEFMSRLQYYSDFTIDRQKKINSMISNLSSVQTTVSSTSPIADDLSTRQVEGAESPESPVKVSQRPGLSSGSDNLSTPSSHHRAQRRPHKKRSSRRNGSRPIASSTMLDESFSSGSSGRLSHHTGSLVPKASSTMISDSASSSGSGRRSNRTGGSNPRACSTMLEESFLSSGSQGSQGSSRHRSSSIPMANSTMITDPPVPICAEISISRRGSRSSACPSDNDDLESIFTWSIHDEDNGSDDMNLEASYLKNVHIKKAMGGKPPLPPTKRVRSGSASSRDSNGSGKHCQDPSLHRLLGDSCSKLLVESISAIEPNASGRDGALLVDSMYDDDDCVPKIATLPRSSTKMRLQDKSSGSSSLEARRTSLPDLYSVCTSGHDDFHSVPNSLNSDSESEEDLSPEFQERLACPGRSSSSNEKSGQSGQASGTTCSELAKDSLVDSILTDSPNSISSSGLHAPQNSPGTNYSSSSKVSCSTTSDAKSSDSNANLRGPPGSVASLNIKVDSPKVQNTEAVQSELFKVPKQTQPLRKLFRFRRSKCKTPDLRTSTPRVAVSSVHSDPLSKRQLFPSGAGATQTSPRVMDKKAVIKKFKRFSDNFYKKDKSGRVKIETLANL